MRFKLRAGPNTPLTGVWDSQIVSVPEGIRGAGYATFPRTQGGLQTRFISPPPSSDARSPRLPAALFLKALWQDLGLVDKH